jgi:predicted ATPase
MPQPSASRLPESPHKLLGRAAELRLLGHYLTGAAGQTRLVTICGLGGIGKTRLALESAKHHQVHFRDGARFVELAAVREPSLVLAAIQHAVAPGVAPGRDAMEALQHSLSNQHLLLVLDNFEQVQVAARLVAELLAACPNLSVLVTSRSPLHLKWERVLTLGPLPVPEAELDARPDRLLGYTSVSLLLERLYATDSTSNPQPQQLEVLAEICRQLAGIPLAIELAAARARVLGLADLASRLDRQLHVLTYGSRDAPERQRTLRLTFDWSFDLLLESDQRIFSHLGVFVGGCTFAAAAAVCDRSPGDLDLADALGRLVESGLVTVVDTATPAESRLQLLEPVREYARDRLRQSGELENALNRHANEYVHVAETANAHFEKHPGFGLATPLQPRSQQCAGCAALAARSW